MKNHSTKVEQFAVCVFALATFFHLSTTVVLSAQETAKDIIDHVDRIFRGDSSHGIARMKVITEHWQRSITMELWSLGTDYSLVTITAPAKEAGTGTLKAKDNIWNYLPKVDRTIKIPPSMMMGSWMGSHFTNDDLVKRSTLTDDYDVKVNFDGERDGIDILEIHLTPKPEAAVVWSHIEFRVRKSDVMPMSIRYFDEDYALVRTLTFSDFKSVDGRMVPFTMNMYPEDKPNELTSFRYSDLSFEVNLDESFFSLQSLKQWRHR